jgi:hypothetical protein
MLEIVSAAVPVFVSVEVCEPLVVPTRCEPKARLVGFSETDGAGVAPVPLRPRTCGLPLALSAIETLAVRLPAAPGENVTEIVHVALAPSVDGLIGQLSLSP